jgi:hypothetical protein
MISLRPLELAQIIRQPQQEHTFYHDTFEQGIFVFTYYYYLIIVVFTYYYLYNGSQHRVGSSVALLKSVESRTCCLPACPCGLSVMLTLK